MPTLATPYADLLGLKVRVYRNLHNGLFSVQHRGRVIAHLPAVYLANVTFQVQPAGRAKVLTTKTKNVHAYVSGTVSNPMPDEQLPTGCTYNPYRAATFTERKTGNAVTAAPCALVAGHGIFV